MIIFSIHTFGSMSLLSNEDLVLIARADSPIVLDESINVTGDFTFTGDLIFSNAHGLIVKADGITIDGAGYRIIGNKTVASCEWITATDPSEATAGHGILNNGYDNVVVKNLEIENFATGIWLHGTGPNKVLNNRIENCEIHDNGLDDMGGSSSESITHGVHMAYVRDSEIIGNEIYNNEGTGNSCTGGGNGIFIQGGGSDSDEDYVTIVDNKLHHNGKAGFWTRMVMDHSKITGNEIWENGNGTGITDPQRGGIVLRCVKSNWFEIEENQIRNNYGDGIFIGGFNCNVSNNVVTNNTQNGIHLGRSDGSQNNYLYENIICSNAEYDVYNCHENYGGNNIGDENTGDTAHNYRDEGTTGDIHFICSCSTPDTISPETIITSGPSGTIDYDDVSFSWTGSDNATSTQNLKYSYKLQGYDISWSTWSASTSKDYDDLPNAGYTFKVKAKDEAGNVDPTPAERVFTVNIEEDEEDDDTISPETTISGGPSGMIDYKNVIFSWIGSDDITSVGNLEYSYILEGKDPVWSGWTTSTSKTYNNLLNGDHSFKVKARDKAGNVDPTPAERSFTVNYSETADAEVDDFNLLTEDFTFTEDITVPSGHGFIVGADNITIDGNGFTLDGISPGDCEGGIVEHCGIYNSGYDNVIIKNLEIKNFCTGIYLTYNSAAGNIVYGNIIDNCKVHHNGNDEVEWTESHGIKMVGVSDSIVKNCQVYNNKGAGDGCEDGGNGIFLKGTSSGDGGKRNKITNNEIFNNTKGGFFTKMKPENTIVDNNTIYGNGQGGIILRCMLSKTHIIENNLITENFGCGIFIGGPDNTIKNNVITNNKDGSTYTGIVGEYGTGIDFGRNDGSHNNSLFDNIICGNEAVDVEAYNSNDISGNHGFGNTGMTATNYRDDGTSGTTYFTYSCDPLSSENDDRDVKSVVTRDDGNQTPGFEAVLLVFALTTIMVYYASYKKKRGVK